MSLVAAIAQSMSSIYSFVCAVLIAKFAGISVFGEYTEIILLGTIYRNFLIGLILNPAATIQPKITAKANLTYSSVVIAIFVAFLLICSGVTAIFVSTFLGQSLLFLIASCAYCSLVLTADLVRRYHFINHLPKRAAAVDLARGLLGSALVGTVSLAGIVPLSSISYLAATGAAELFAILITLVPTRLAWSPRHATATWRRHRKFAIWMLPTLAFEAAQTNGLMLLAGMLLGEQLLGSVRAMQSLANALNLPFNALQQVAPTIAARALKEGGQAGLRKRLVEFAHGSIGATLAIGILVYLLSGPLIHGLFDLEPEGNLALLMVFCAVNGFIAVRFPLTVGMQAIEATSALILPSAIGAIAGLGFLLVCVQSLGVLSVPCARLVALACSTVATWLSARTLLRPSN
jgi:O-antigen/teichoic acid export membrane protein